MEGNQRILRPAAAARVPSLGSFSKRLLTYTVWLGGISMAHSASEQDEITCGRYMLWPVRLTGWLDVA
jgi:hypothetical protein